MRCRKVTTKWDFARWMNFTDQLYQTSEFVPPIRQQLRSLYCNQGNKHGTRASFHVVEDDAGNVLARTTVHCNDALDEKLGSRVQLFGFTECVENYQAFETLVNGIENIARANGRKVLFGPSNLLPNDYGGVISAGFDLRGFLDSAYNLPYYPAFFAQAGFGKRFTSSTYICDSLQTGPDPDHVLPFDETRIEREQLEIHYGDRRRIKSQLELLRQMLNASFAARPYYTDISAADLHERMEGLAYLLDERLLIYVTRAGTPVAFIICLPDISPFLAKVRGNLDYFGQLALLFTRKNYRREAILIIGGVVPGEEGAGYGRLMMRQLFRNLRSGGYHTLRTTSVELNNPGARNAVLKMNGHPLHELSYYERSL